MSQRYFLTAESTYEDLRQSLNVALAYPNALGKSVFQTALYAPRDNFRRVLLAVDTDLPGYTTVDAAISPLLDSDAVEEIDEATYLAALASAAPSWGSAATIRRFDGSGNTSYIGTAPSGTAESSTAWRIKKTTIAAGGGVSSSLTAANVAWTDRLTATYS